MKEGENKVRGRFVKQAGPILFMFEVRGSNAHSHAQQKCFLFYMKVGEASRDDVKIQNMYNSYTVAP